MINEISTFFSGIVTLLNSGIKGLADLFAGLFN